MRKFLRIILIIGGCLSLFLGALGILLPLLPTTPFLLLAAACFVRSSDKLYNWLLNNKWFGTYIQDFRSGKGIPLQAKIIGVTVLWVSILFSAFAVVEVIFVRVILIITAAFFTWVMLSFPTRR
ncbi:YbaN family protein [Thalassobacillus pellis]|uniref:YbaN family protein n=1 Tax=Thalassobacillus pellis TaxID=748008 RepID=UPI001960EA48|nr:YbaN family protein [Thalassobacillus pellis]MBM7552123.1 uncharacterized membrane protein YbaN (DUF454 family) [Thalassobacillus pellis]